MRYFLVFFTFGTKHGDMAIFSGVYPNREDVVGQIASKLKVAPIDVSLTNIVEVSKEDFLQYAS